MVRDWEEARKKSLQKRLGSTAEERYKKLKKLKKEANKKRDREKKKAEVHDLQEYDERKQSFDELGDKYTTA